MGRTPAKFLAVLPIQLPIQNPPNCTIESDETGLITTENEQLTGLLSALQAEGPRSRLGDVVRSNNELFHSPRRRNRASFLREGEAVDRFTFETFVRVQVLLRGLDVAMAHELLDGDDVAPAFKQSGRVGVAELVERGVWDFGGIGDFL